MSSEEDMEEALKEFVGQFGNPDIYTQIVLEEFFRELMGRESVHLPGEAE